MKPYPLDNWLDKLEAALYRKLDARHQRAQAAKLPPGPLEENLTRCPIHGGAWIDDGRGCTRCKEAALESARARTEFSRELLLGFIERRAIKGWLVTSENEFYAALVAWLMTAHPQTTVPASSKVRAAMEELGYEYIAGKYSEETLVTGIGLVKEQAHVSEARI